MRELATVFSALADPTRLDILALLLRNRELCVCDFVESLAISQSKASRHLRHLWNARLLEDRRDGLWVYYRVSPSLDPARAKIIEALERVFDEQDLSELDKKVASWMKRKARGNGCAVAPARRTSASSASKPATKPRRAAEARR